MRIYIHPLLAVWEPWAELVVWMEQQYFVVLEQY